MTSALVSWPVAVALAAVLACITGAISLRTRGVYFIMITLAFAQMLFYIFISLRQYGGEDGLNLPGPSTLPGLSLGDDVSFYYLVLALFTLLSWLFGRLVASASAPRCKAYARTSRAWSRWAIRSTESSWPPSR